MEAFKGGIIINSFKVKLKCPKCNCEEAVSYSTKIFMVYHMAPECRKCGVVLSNPSWFDILRLAIAIMVAYFTYSIFQNRGMPILVVFIYWIMSGIISLRFVSLEEHWNR